MPRVGLGYTADDVREMAESGICEPSRLLHICAMIEAGRPLYNSDRAYLDRIASRLADKEAALRRENRRISRVLGAGPRASEAAAAPRAPTLPLPAPDPAPAVIDAGLARPNPAPPSEAGRRHRGQGAPPPAPSRKGPLHEKAAPAALPTRPRSDPAAPETPSDARAPVARRTLIGDDEFDAILERRDRRRRSEARERAAEAAAPSRNEAASPAPPRPPRSEDRAAKSAPPAPTIAGRIRGIVAGRR